ncbi:hypothetical protein AGMMS49587_14050 [Spirochaetia bacterium]|nr:hypothetical protein AGMMS49587_14050 [Spirochaetia bacterium]
MNQNIPIDGLKIKNWIRWSLILGIVGCLLLQIPQIRELIIVFGESAVMHRPLTHSVWHERIIACGLIGAVFCLFTLLLLPLKYRGHIFFGVLAIIVVAGVIVSIFLNIPLSAVITLLFSVFSFALMFSYMCLFHKDLRDAFISSTLYDAVFLWVLTEFLGFFKLLGFTGILCGWIWHDICLLSLLILKCKKENFKIKKLVLRVPQLRWEYCALGVILAVSFFIALWYPPNNWDSMAYHLPRIEHWLQNKSLDHFYTSNVKQTMSAPFAEMVILQGRALSGDDWLMNLVQWFAFFGTIMGISKITSHLGLNKTMQITAAVFFVTLPMAILQASSTQTDLVEAFWIVCLAERFLTWKKEKSLRHSIDFGIALGLAILTKGTAYPIAFPFVLCFAVLSIKHFRKHLPGAFLAALVCLAINAPHYTRNYIAFENPLGAHSGTVSNFSIKSFFITLAFDIYANLPLPLPDNIGNKVNAVLKNIDSAIFPFDSPEVVSIRWYFSHLGGLEPAHEDIARNCLQMLLIIIIFVMLLSRSKSKIKYAWIVLGSWCMFAFCIPWQPWITRLQLPLFALSAPVFAQVLENKKYLKKRKVILMSLCCCSLFPLFFNASRPLISYPGFTGGKTIINASRDELIFNNPSLYVNACTIIAGMNHSRLGLIIGENSLEYPLWRYLRHNMDVLPNIIHVKPDSIDQNIDVLFILDRKDIPFMQDSMDDSEDNRPLVLQRIDGTNNWKNVLP